MMHDIPPIPPLVVPARRGRFSTGQHQCPSTVSALHLFGSFSILTACLRHGTRHSSQTQNCKSQFNRSRNRKGSKVRDALAPNIMVLVSPRLDPLKKDKAGRPKLISLVSKNVCFHRPGAGLFILSYMACRSTRLTVRNIFWAGPGLER